MAPPVLRHRLMPSFAAEAAGHTPDIIIQRLLAGMPGGPPAVPPKIPTPKIPS
jgi:hypothetical protein